MSTQQDIYAAGSENHPLMLNKDNYVPWSSRIIRYARSRPNGKMIVDTIENRPYNDIKRMDADDQAIQTNLLGLPEDVYDVVDSYLAKTHDPLALMAHSQNSYNFPVTHKDQSSSSNHSQQSLLIYNKYNPQSSLNQNFMQPPMTFPEDINDPTEAMNATLILFAKAFQLTAPTNNNQRTSSNPRNRQIAKPGMNMSQDRQSQNVGGNEWACSLPGIANQNGSCNIVVARVEGSGNRNQAKYYNCRGLLIQLQVEEFNFMAAAGDLDEIEEVNANCILMANLQHASTSGTQLDKALVYDTDGSAKVQLNDNCYDNEIFNMFTQEEQYTDLLKPILEPQLVPQNDNHVNSVAQIWCKVGKIALGYPNFSYLKKAQLKQQSLYNGNLLLEEHDPPVVYDSEETLELAQESRKKMRLLKKEIKPANYA
nr:hypothetical protein [Tanacetum cinerariifolium]